MNSKRMSNFELMRIVSMIFIVFWHFLLFGKMQEGTTGATRVLIVFLKALTLVHVNSFVLLTGYFNYEKRFKLSKVIKVNNTMWFYKVACLLIMILCFSESFSNFYIFKTFSPIPNFTDYWFLVVYMLLYLVSPLLNMIINNCNKKKHLMIIVGLFIVSLLSYITFNGFYDINDGYSLFSFILLYFIGAFLHKYPLESKKYTKTVIVISLFFFVFLAAANMTIYGYANNFLHSSNTTLRYYSTVLAGGFTAYSNPLIILGSIFYFIIFSQIKFSSRIVNFIGKNVLGAYLITQNVLVFERMYKPLGFASESYGSTDILIAIGLSILLVIVCALIEALRSLLFKFIYDRKLSCKLRDKIKKLFKKVDINW